MDILPPRDNPQVNAAPAQPAPAPIPAPNLPPAAPPPPPKFEDESHWRSILSTVGLLASALLIAVLLNTFVIQSYQVDGQSMQQTLQNDDRLIVNKVPRTLSRITGHQYVPKRGQIIIFNEDGLPGFIGQKQLIKRVIGLPGERVVISNGHYTVYNQEHPEGFNPDTAGIYTIDQKYTTGQVDQTLAADEIFVSGDNRANSEDSRYFGPVKTNQVVAALILRILPLNKAEKF